MPDIIRTRAELEDDLVDNDTGDILASTIRNFLASVPLTTELTPVPFTGSSWIYETPANPTGNTSTTEYKMMGVGDTAQFTTSVNGQGLVKFAINGVAENVNLLEGYSLQVVYGVGTPPANGDPWTGTQIGATITAANGSQHYHKDSIIEVDAGDTIWFDVAVKALVSGTALAKDIEISAYELPYQANEDQ